MIIAIITVITMERNLLDAKYCYRQRPFMKTTIEIGSQFSEVLRQLLSRMFITEICKTYGSENQIKIVV